MKKLASGLIVILLTCFIVGSFAGDFYVIPVQKKIQNATRVPKTGQTSCSDSSGTPIDCTDTGQDGEYQMGILPAVAPSDRYYTAYGWSGTRFTDNNDGTVTDNLTGLIWLKNAGCFGGGYGTNWANALSDSNNLASGSCGLTDGSAAGDWRLPNFNELRSLIDPGESNPALPDGHPFAGVKNIYWCSTTTESLKNLAWELCMNDNTQTGSQKVNQAYVWPVRSDN